MSVKNLGNDKGCEFSDREIFKISKNDISIFNYKAVKTIRPKHRHKKWEKWENPHLNLQEQSAQSKDFYAIDK